VTKVVGVFEFLVAASDKSLAVANEEEQVVFI
jgi:hypothetical protein